MVVLTRRIKAEGGEEYERLVGKGKLATEAARRGGVSFAPYRLQCQRASPTASTQIVETTSLDKLRTELQACSAQHRLRRQGEQSLILQEACAWVWGSLAVASCYTIISVP